MATCRDCRTELLPEQIGCLHCSPDVAPESLDAIERHSRWAAAKRHHVWSRRGNLILGIGVIVFIGLGLVWSSYSDAVDRGDTSGRGMMIGMFIAGGLFVVGGLALHAVPLQRSPAVVLATFWSTTTNSKGQSSANYYVHVASRPAPRSLGVDRKHLELLAIGAPVILFVRWGWVDDVWAIPGEVPSARSSMTSS